MEKKSFENTFLVRTYHKLYIRFGEGFSVVLGIMAFFFVTCGLFIGVLGRGWLAAWIFVFVGLLFSIFPIISYLLGRFGVQNNLTDDVPTTADSAASFPHHEIPPLDEATIKAIEFEAALARKKVIERENARRELKEKNQLEKQREEARQATRNRQQELNRKNKAVHHSQRSQNFNAEYFKQERFQQSPQISKGFFQGITDKASLRKRYLDLLKIYHPDNQTGDIEITRSLQKEYQELVTFFEAYEKHQSK